MIQFSCTTRLFGAAINVHVLRLDEGIQVTIFGGTRPHVGAVSIADGPGGCRTVEFPGHRDGTISRRWAEALAEAGCGPAVVTAGIHYDHLSREAVGQVVAVSDGLLADVLGKLGSGQGTLRRT